MKKSLPTLLFFFILTNCYAQFQTEDKGTIVTLKVAEVSTGEILLSQHEELRLTPASLTKIITTATALELLGPEFTYSTKFYALGKIKKGKLLGNLLIKSSGDPTLGSKYFEQTKPEIIYNSLANALNMAGIKSIDGTVVIESDKINYSAPRLWEDMGNYYGASPQGFNWRDNTAVLTLRSAEIGSTATLVSLEPHIAPYTVRCLAVAGSHNKDSAYVYGLKNLPEWWIEGSIPPHRHKFRIKSALPDPAQAFKNGLEDFLRNRGINISHNPPLHAASTEQITLFTHQSPPLSGIIKTINQQSHNLFADQLLLTLGKLFKGTPSWDNGNQVVREFWLNKISFEDNFRLRDGSGLTPKNLISASGMVELLIWMEQNSKNFAFYAQSLAKGGETGTLRTTFKNPAIKGKLIGKSGSMEGVLGYCGYLTTLSGKKTAFCILTNNYIVPTKQIREKIDQIMTGLILEK
ncbi:D-alanyl-D-alanine carboxypeptidase / D-alanyl-D-alanine-endopeptidase (penicillin-binding protein 4) [Saccharicrinis carchari]|uniref:D-alanyl-D-alanine carboxypeptidase / D-alanyl-D-alanine-endopeptidase (Penicillin-binding protein 4) n=1 Tax=Saccharicrinis carchari TaxID=1168039 RepID=A0A521DRB3_SACCC|nr:D-alanyl-D-alanine carboxypeptidase/D-alanyl-D-alanine-endopeptidase [Saccharicrinis carchari]SMO74236.1 D-alanyl-D-alanine carboxypeptidase / D-alanyl-D-alanine-endopeptidase (penicillin-binding protein 4) [Saccharicrinis carchari]